MLPLLKRAEDGAEHSLQGEIEALAEFFGLTFEERAEMLPSGQQARFNNRVHWARSYMKQARLIENTRRSCFKITQRGKDLLRENPQLINMRLLERYPEYVQFKERKRDENDSARREEVAAPQEQTPEELLEQSYRIVNEALAIEVLQRVKECSPAFFERLVVELLVKMGYGGTRQDAGRAIGGSGDEGIDGIINEDRLGLDAIYIQAKRWDSGVVGRPEIMKFVGALQGKRAHKGVFITTSCFTKDSQAYVENISNKVVLIDGASLARLMLENNVGVSSVRSFDIKRIDSDYFSDE